MYDVIIIGGGIVGLATAVRLKEAKPDWRIILFEKENELAHHQTGNNSGVIHSGIYYKPGSLKALNCRTGYRMMLDFCEKESIPHELCGKLIIATQPEELPRLEVLHERGIANGLTGLIKIGADQIQVYEPQARGIAALWVPQTGIVDFKVVARRYAEIFERRQGGEICLQHKVVAIRKRRATSRWRPSRKPMKAVCWSTRPACIATGWRRWPVSPMMCASFLSEGNISMWSKKNIVWCVT